MKRTTPLQEVMKGLEGQRDLAMPMDAEYYERLHARIMEGIARLEAKSEPKVAWYEKPTRLLREHWHSWRTAGAYMAAGSAMSTSVPDDVN